MNYAQAGRYLDARAAKPLTSALLKNVPSGKYSQQGNADLTKGLGDCSSAVEDLVNLLGGKPTSGRSMSTGNAAEWLTSRGFMPGTAPGAFNVGFNDHHMQATMMDGTNFNWGSNGAAMGRGIGGSLGAYDPSLTRRFHRYMGGGGSAGTQPGKRNFGGDDSISPGVGGISPPSMPPGVGGLSPLGTGSPLQGVGPQGLGGGGPMLGGSVPQGMGAVPDGGYVDTTRQLQGSGGGGFGISGGILGALFSGAGSAAGMAASLAADGAAPGSGAAAGAAAQIGTQLANRFVGYAGQVAGIGVSGLLETFGLSGSAIADPSKSIFGKLALGIAGAHPSAPNTAGESAQPLKPKPDDPKDGQKEPQGAAPLVNIENMNNHGADGQQVATDIARQTMPYMLPQG